MVGPPILRQRGPKTFVEALALSIKSMTTPLKVHVIFQMLLLRSKRSATFKYSLFTPKITTFLK